MKKEKLATACLGFFLSVPIVASAASRARDLAKADWSVNAVNSLASNPPSLDAVQRFYDRANGDDMTFVRVCDFRFANLRKSDKLSLILTIEPSNWGCDELYIFDVAPKGFEVYAGAYAQDQDLAHSVLDLNHDGRLELVLWRRLAAFASSWYPSQYGLGCEAELPLIFAWTGSTYSDVSDRHKAYYRSYLNSLNARLTAYSSILAPIAARTDTPVPPRWGSGGSAARADARMPAEAGGSQAGSAGRLLRVTPAPIPQGARPAWAVRNEAHRNYPCARIEVAKTEAFLGISSDSTMTAAIKDSESDDPQKRIGAAVVFSYLGTEEAAHHLKMLSGDADPRVAAIAKRVAAFENNPQPEAMRRDDYLSQSTQASEPERQRGQQ